MTYNLLYIANYIVENQQGKSVALKTVKYMEYDWNRIKHKNNEY